METYNKCTVCAKETKNKTFCSKQCQSIDFKNKQRKCPICGKSTPNKVYCSEKCQWESQKGCDKEKWEMIKCLNCEIEIKRLKTRKSKQFCSKKCRKTYEINNKIGIYDPKNRILKFGNETKLKHSKITKKLWESEEHRRKVKISQLKKYKELGHWFGCDEKSTEKRRETCLKKYGVEVCGRNLKEIRDKIYKTCLKKYGKYPNEMGLSACGKITKIEKIVENILINKKIDFIKQYRVYYNEKKHKYKIFDFFVLEKNILIEVDGDYWHGNPRFFKTPNEMQKNAIKNDIFKNKLARKKKYKLLRYWENEIYLDEFNIKLINDING
jgi:endogenous inhibitor of DNA gyrase (YacG/DUF329 family)